MSAIEVLPRDEHNLELVRQTHPADWKNPTPQGKYDLVAIGGGTAGIIAALGTAGVGGRSALIERHLLGGDCLNYGCVPSKALIRAAKDALRIADCGLRIDGQHESAIRNLQSAIGPSLFPAAMERMRRLRAQISHHDSAQRFAGLGVDVYLGSARFTGPQSVEVGGQRLEFKRCVIATGARAAKADIPGIEQVGYLTNETVFSLTELPRRLIVIGGGPIGCELAQAFRRFGSEVQLVHRGARLLPKDDPRAADVLQKQFAREGIAVYLNSKTVRAEPSAAGKRLVIEAAGKEQTLVADAILVAVGRAVNVEGLEFEAAGVKYSSRGVEVNDFLQTGNPRIYAAGDIAGSYQFTHAADAMARACIQNALFFGRQRLSRMVMPWCTYTDPEVAHVGLTAAAAEKQGIAIDSYREELSRVDRAVLDGEEDGFAVVHCRRGTGRVVGATIVARHAGEMIGELSLLMTAGLSLGTLAGTIHAYPTQVEVLKRIADQYNKTRLTPFVARLLRVVLRWRS
ncbi:MAG TPA: mercuric reductase [Pirellulaceae bacterium]|nr:mercuric reductase [Pirellulaceae bacterium]